MHAVARDSTNLNESIMKKRTAHSEMILAGSLFNITISRYASWILDFHDVSARFPQPSSTKIVQEG